MDNSSADDIDLPTTTTTPAPPATEGEPPVAPPPAPPPLKGSRYQDYLKIILEMNRAGKSAREISRVTGIPPTTVRRYLKRLAKDPRNGVLDNSIMSMVDNPKWRNHIENGKWFKIIKHIRDVDLPFYDSEGFKPMIRTLLYRLDSLKLLDKTKDYKSLIKYTVRARELNILPAWLGTLSAITY